MALAAAGTAALAPTAAAAFDPAVEAKTFSKIEERQTIYDTPQYQLDLRRIGLQNAAASLAIQAADPERSFQANLCAQGQDGCAGDVRLYDWKANGYGLVEPVLFTARNGATISGHVWATRSGPSQRPGVVITNGSVQADEQAGRGRLPGRPVGPRAGGDHQARAGHVGRLRAAPDAQHLPARPDGQVDGVAGLYAGRRRHRRDHHPRRLAPGLLVHPQPGLRRQPARRRRDRLVHDRVVRQVRQGRPDDRSTTADRPLAPRRRRGRDRPRPRRQHVLLLLPSRLDVGRRGGGRFDCEDLRAGCPGLSGDDGYAGEYSYVAIARSPDW